MAISNKYKDLLNNFIDSSDFEFLLRLINKKLYNLPKSKNSLTYFLEKHCLNKDVLAFNRLL